MMVFQYYMFFTKTYKYKDCRLNVKQIITNYQLIGEYFFLFRPMTNNNKNVVGTYLQWFVLIQMYIC